MLTVEKIAETAVEVQCDDANSELASLEEAISAQAPHLSADFASMATGEDGFLRWRVERSEYESLLEVLEYLDEEFVDPDEQINAVEFMEKLVQEVQ